MTSTTAFSPDWVSPPGESIEDLLEERGWTQAELAVRADLTTKHVNDLVKGRAVLTADGAERLARVFGSTTDFWLVREAQYRARLQERATGDALAADATWLKELPLKWLREVAGVQRVAHKGVQVAECLRFFGVASVHAWREQYERPLAAYRASRTHKARLGSLSAWLRQCERHAESVDARPFDRTAFRSALDQVRALTTESSRAALTSKLVELCAACGVAVVFVPAPSGCPVSGATRWLTPTKALLALSLRHKSNDHLWFTFFHEAGHLILHGKKLQFVDGIEELDGGHETQADAFARDMLVSPQDAPDLAGLTSRSAIIEFSARIGLAPGIVVGRLQRDRVIKWSAHNDLKVHYSADDTDG